MTSIVISNVIKPESAWPVGPGTGPQVGLVLSKNWSAIEPGKEPIGPAVAVVKPRHLTNFWNFILFYLKFEVKFIFSIYL